MKLRRPKRGSIVDVVAPAGPFDPDGFGRGLEWLSLQGFRPRVRDDIFSRQGFLAGDDTRRRDELLAALRADDSDLIWAARGGYGCTRIVETIPSDLIRDAGKLLVGFSDLTVMHLAWRAAGVPSVHGSMVARLATEPDEVRDRLLRLLRGDRASPLSGVPLASGTSEGPLVGGNLVLLTATLGTRFQPDLRGAIVCLEEVGERPYRVDRMLVQCRQAGLFDGVAGLALGGFTGCEERDGTSHVDEVLREHALSLGVPAVGQLPFGHGEVNHALVLGRTARLDGDTGLLQFVAPLFDEAGA